MQFTLVMMKGRGHTSQLTQEHRQMNDLAPTSCGSAIDEVLRIYSKAELLDIAQYGCVAGTAGSHIYYSQTKEFYDDYETQILDYLEDVMGENPIHLYSKESTSMAQLTNTIVWAFIESIAETAVLEDEDYNNQ